MDADSLRAEIESLKVNQAQHADRLHLIEERFDTLNTRVWKRLVFRLDGWGPWHVVRERPRWRPWRRWGTS